MKRVSILSISLLMALSLFVQPEEETQVVKAAVTTIIIISAALILSIVAASVLGNRKTERPTIDDKPTTLSSRGSFLNRTFGRHKVAPVFCWAGARVVNRKARGGKGFSGGAEISQDLYEEEAWHVLGIGPLQALYTIYANGNPIWRGDLQRPLTNAPVEVDVSNKEGTFVVYWGTDPQELNNDLAKHLNVVSTWPHIAYIYWKPKNLGPSNSWPTIEYECEFRPENSFLTQSQRWVDEEEQFSSTPLLIKDTRNGEPGRNYVQVRDDQRTRILVGYDVRIEGQTAQGGAANGDYLVLSLEFDETLERWRRWDETITNWDQLNPSNTVVTPLGGGVYRLQGIDPLQSAGVYEVTEFFLTPVSGVNNQELFQAQFQNNGLLPSEVVIEFFNQTNSARSASLKFRISGSTINVIEERGISSYRFLLQAAGAWIVEITVIAGDTQVLAQVGDIRAASIRFEPQPSGHDSDVTVSGIRIDESRGTNIFLNETFGNQNPLRDDEGTVLPSEILDFDGANPAHILTELLFADSPHGMGLSQEGFFDVDTLEELGVALSNSGEDAAANITVAGSTTGRQLMERFLMDLGCALPTNVLSGLVEFLLIRSPAEIYVVPEELVVAPLPEIEALHDDPTTQAVVYSFPDRRRNYRESTMVLNDSGTASYADIQGVKTIGLSIATDLGEAEKIANRRELEEISKPTKFKLYLNRGARTLKPGEVIYVPSVIDENLRIIQITSPPDNDGKVTLDVVIDFFGTAPRGALMEGAFGDGWIFNNGPVPPVSDPLFRFWELPRVLVGTSAEVAVLRCRATSQTGPAEIWLSPTNVVYNNVGSHGDPHLAGLTLEELSAEDPWSIPGDSIEVDWDGPPDFSSVEELSGDVASWAAGRQLCLLVSPGGEEEILFVQGITITDTGKARLKGLLRGRYATGRHTFPAGSECYIFQNDVPRFTDSISILPDKTLYLKTQPRTSTPISIDSVKPFSKKLAGNWITPLPPAHLRTANGIPYYAPSGDISLLWNFRSSGGAIYRTGAGYQGAGAATGSHPPDGNFELIVKDPSQQGTQITKIISPAFGTTLTNSEITTAFGGEPAQLNFELRAVESGRYSDAALLSIIKLIPA